ncbi:MAG: Holliday junction branch migration protein RuvA [gamma proteobacterium symbiont of Lucinoma myriamae]|nr:Holliday junction branch migration protein RuvA [gamma proteobacterium symbiont of Lucinoma myriamae]MCU7820055.1 Holliday junction branch migration protein RuvA [gamma proteobacterium symbiont of Lucinoma myriamae]MCU7831473.1 Holliday junction branch migration protein RuvA [gamma proteobacterium symbiont of Lucinoma myriamae]
MIGRLSGTLIQKQPPVLMIDVHGVGYEVQAPMSTFYQLPELEQPVVLLIHMVVREDAQLLYGFYSESERLLFKSLIKVNGVGPKLALAILSGISANKFVQVVKNNDESGLVRLPGIGKKTAQRLIVEMKDRLSDWQGDGTFGQDKASTGSDNLSTEQDIIKEATSALIALGYKPVEASKMISKLDKKQDQSSESLIKQALKNTVR